MSVSKFNNEGYYDPVVYSDYPKGRWNDHRSFFVHGVSNSDFP